MISRRMGEKIKTGSAIRAAFNEAGRLRAQYGADAVFDLSLGNPGAPAPARVREEACRLLDDPALDHGYMSDAGYEGVREQVAGYLNRVYDAGCTREHVIMSVGAAGGINAVLCALLDRGDQVIVFRPYYPAYVNFIENAVIFHHEPYASSASEIIFSSSSNFSAIESNLYSSSSAIVPVCAIFFSEMMLL